MPAADIGNDIGKRGRKGRLALASSDRNKSVQQLGQASPKKKPPLLGEGLGWFDLTSSPLSKRQTLQPLAKG